MTLAERWAAFSPRERVLFDFSYRGEIRESNRPRFDYDSQSVSIACEFRF